MRDAAMAGAQAYYEGLRSDPAGFHRRQMRLMSNPGLAAVKLAQTSAKNAPAMVESMVEPCRNSGAAYCGTHIGATALGAAGGAGWALRGAKAASRTVPEVNWDGQTKHFLGHNDYILGRSQLTADPRKLVQQAGSGEPVGKYPRGAPNFKERIDFGETIGVYVGRNGEEPSSRGMLVYSKKGVKIYPVRPR